MRDELENREMKRPKELRRKGVEKKDWEAAKAESLMRGEMRRKSKGVLDQAKDEDECVTEVCRTVKIS